MLAGYHETIRASELDRRDQGGTVNQVARNNGLKGHIPTVRAEGHTVEVHDIADHDYLVRNGFVWIGDYKGDHRDRVSVPRSYYQSTVAGKGRFNQGVAQNVTETWQGVDSRIGVSKGDIAGLETGKSAKAIAREALQAPEGSMDRLPAGEYLRPIFGANGTVTGYQRSVDSSFYEGIQEDTHLGRMLGVWAGRIVEEKAAEEYNSALLTVLKETWDQAVREGRTDKFTNVADENHPDPVVRDAWDTLGWRMKAEANRAFGGLAWVLGEFWITRGSGRGVTP